MRSKLSASAARTRAALVLGRPIARRTAAVLLPGEYQQRRFCGAIFRRRIEDRHFFAVRQMPGVSAFAMRREFVAQTHVGKRAAHHHFVIAAARPIGIEVRRRDAVRNQILPRRAVVLDRTGGEMWSVVTLFPR